MGKQKQEQKYYYDRSAKPLSNLTKGENMHMKAERGWRPAEVVDAVHKRSYTVKIPEGQEFGQNRRDLRPTHNYDAHTSNETSSNIEGELRVREDNQQAPQIPSR